MEVGRLSGSFGLVTVGLLDVLAQAHGRHDRLVAHVRSDAAVERHDGRPPVMPLEERLRLVAALRHVDAVEVAPDDEDLLDATGAGPADAETYVLVPGSDHGRGVVLSPRADAAPLPSAADLLHARRRGPGDVGTRTGYVPGGWDLFHDGHLRILERARAQCDRLVVGVVTDEGLAAAKGRLPVVPFAERAAVVAAFALVDDVVTDTSADKRLAWERVGFDVLFKGDDWQGTAKGDRLEAEMAEVGVELRYFPYTPHTSSTALRAALDAR